MMQCKNVPSKLLRYRTLGLLQNTGFAPECEDTLSLLNVNFLGLFGARDITGQAHKSSGTVNKYRKMTTRQITDLGDYVKTAN